MIDSEIKDLFKDKIEEKGECWIWTGGKHLSGYGTIRKDNKFYYVHRYVKILSLGREIEIDKECCHSCYNKLCINPSHIREDSRKSNMIDNVISGHHNTLKLDIDKVLSIRKKAELGVSQKSLAEEYNVTTRNINKIVNRKSWKFIP